MSLVPVQKKVNKDFFKKWSHQMAYVLGFFFADGSHDVNSRGSEYFSFQIIDKKLLYVIRSVLVSDHKVAVRTPRNDNESVQYRLQIGSKEMCSDLRKLGVMENKSKTMHLPDIPNKFVGSFLRGYFDGDGNVWCGHVHKERKKPLLVLQVGFTSASEHFLLDLKTRLSTRGLHGGSLYCKKRAFCLKYSTSDSLFLYKLMYRELGDSELFLRRKKKVFDTYLRDAAVAQFG